MTRKSRQSPPLYNPEWARAHAEAYKAWKEGQTIPESGTPIKTWPVISPAQAKNLVTARIYTVEDLAAANEDTLRLAGMGARELKAKAIAWIEQATGAGTLVAKLAAQDAKPEDQAAQIASLLEANKAMQAQLESSARPVENTRKRKHDDVVT